jgi:hypothetical protein
MAPGGQGQAQGGGGPIRIFRQQQRHTRVPGTEVGLVNARIGHDVSGTMPCDQHVGSCAQNRAGVRQDEFDQARIFARDGREAAGLGAWIDIRQADETVFCFRDDFLGNDQNVSGLGLQERCQQRGEIGAGFNLADAAERMDGDHANQPEISVPVI